MISRVLPESVKAKCNILGSDWQKELLADLTPEAYAWVVASSSELVHAGAQPLSNPTQPRTDQLASASALESHAATSPPGSPLAS